MTDWDMMVGAAQEALEALTAKGDAMADRIDALTAKLAKAVEALHNAAIQLDWCQAAREISKEIDATLAEIKGESHE